MKDEKPFLLTLECFRLQTFREIVVGWNSSNGRHSSRASQPGLTSRLVEATL